MRRRGGNLVCCAALLLAPACVAGQQIQASVTPEEAPLTLRYSPYVNVAITALYRGSGFYLPLSETLAALEVEYRRDPHVRRASGVYGTTHTPYSIDIDRLIATVGERRIALSRDSVIITELEFYVRPALLEQLFGWRVTVDEGTLTVTIASDAELPVAESTRRRQKDARLRAAASDTTVPAMRYPREWRALDGGVLQYQLTGARTNAANATTDVAFDAGLGAELLGGDVEGRVRGGTRAGSVAITDRDVRWHYAFGDGPLLSQATVGRIFAAGLQSREMDGIEITNRPVEPRRVLATHAIEGDIQPDWEVELFVNDRLVGYTRADPLGHFRFDVPLTYGTSVIRLRYHGPGGEVRDEDRAVQVPFTFVPPGRADYSLAAGRLTTGGGRVAQGNMAVGLFNWLTSSVGAEYLPDSLPTRPIVYSNLSARVGSEVVMSVDAAPSMLYRATAEMAFPSQAQLTMAGTQYGENALLNPQHLHREMSAQAYVPIRMGGAPFYLRADGSHQLREDGGTSLQWEGDIAANVGALSPSLGYRESAASLPTSGGAGTRSRELRAAGFLFIGNWALIPRPIRGMMVRTAAGYDLQRHGMGELDVYLSQRVGRGKRLEVSYARDFLTGTRRLDLRFLLEGSSLRASTTLHHEPTGETVEQVVSGAVSVDPHLVHVSLSDRQWMGRAGASMRLFLDENGNGTFDDGEALLPGGKLRFDEVVLTQSSRPGVVRAADMQPYHRYVAAVDVSSIKNPLWIPRFPSFSFVADPNRYTTIDVPFYAGGIVEGTVLRRVGKEDLPLPGLRVTLRSADAHFTATVHTFADGTFYHPGVPPGHYEAVIDSTQLELLDASPEPAVRRFEVRATRDGDDVEKVDFLLLPRQPSASQGSGRSDP